MKKARLLLLASLIIALAILSLGGCKKSDKLSSVYIKDLDAETVIEMSLGGFDFDAYTLVASYESGSTEEIALTEDMIAASDVFKLYQVGDHDITVNYGGKSCTLKVSVKRESFSNLKFPENCVFTYDGKAHVVEVEGQLPANATVTYPGGNSFVNAGTYDVTAVVSCDGYVTEKITTTVKIERARYDMSGVKFEAKEFVYDGKQHSVAISGQLPKGVSAPVYTINDKAGSSAVDADVYTVKAVFTVTDPNYEAIPVMETTLTITPAEFPVSGVDIIFKNENGTRINGAVMIYDGKAVTFDLDDYSKISKKLAVTFSVSDKDGNVLSTSNKNTKIKDAGEYTVAVHFALADTKNYQPIPSLVRTFEILKADYPAIENIRFASVQETYDRKAHSIKIDGALPAGVDVSYEYYSAGRLIVDGDNNPVRSVTDAGSYIVKAVFTHNDGNYSKIPELIATLNIEKMVPNLSPIGFENESYIEYSGEAYAPSFKTWKSLFKLSEDILAYSDITCYMLNDNGVYVAIARYTLDENENWVATADSVLPTEIGTYRFSIAVDIAEGYKNNHTLNGTQTIVKQFEIGKKTLDNPTVTFDSVSEWEYRESAKEIAYVCNTDPEHTTVSVSYFRFTAGAYVATGSSTVPSDVGLYRITVTVSIKDTARYVFASGETSERFSFEFEIYVKTLNVSGVAPSFTETDYTGSNLIHEMELIGLPEHANATLNFYSFGSSSPISQMINVGKYRLEVILSAESSNYVLSSSAKLEFEIEITPMEVNVGGLKFDSVEFVYNNTQQHPTLLGIPEEYVSVTTRLYWGDNEHNNSDVNEYGKRLATDVGDYGFTVTLKAKNSNYKLVGLEDSDNCYKTEFKVTPVVIDVTDAVNNTEILLAYKAEGYGDDELKPFVEGLFDYGVVCSTIGAFYKPDGNGGWTYYTNYLNTYGTNTKVEGAVVPGLYRSQSIRLDAMDNYILRYDGEQKPTVSVNICFRVDDPVIDPA